MKTQLFLPFLLLACSSVSAQNNEYFLRNDLLLNECDMQGSTTGKPEKLCPWNAKFTVVKRPDRETWVICFHDWYTDVQLNNDMINSRSWFLAKKKDRALKPESKLLAEKFNYDVSEPYGTERDRYFKISPSLVQTDASPLVSRLSPTFGAIALPFKYRPQKGVVTKDISLGGVGGVRYRPWRRQEFFISATVGVAATSITVDSTSTAGEFKSKTESAGITFPIGLMFQWEKVQFGLFTGWDMLFDANREDWIYQGKQWLSLGVGIGIYSEDSQARSKGN